MTHFASFLTDTLPATRVPIDGKQRVYLGQNRDKSDVRQRWIVAEESGNERIWVFPRKQQARRAAKFAAANPYANALAVLESA